MSDIAYSLWKLTGTAPQYNGSATGTEKSTYDAIEWTDERPMPSWTDVQAEIERYNTEYDAQQYARTRADKYPSWQDQMDMQYHDAVDGTTTWQDAVQAVKDANPKPE